MDKKAHILYLNSQQKSISLRLKISQLIKRRLKL